MLRRAPLYLLVLLLSACQALGLQSPETFNQKEAVAYGSVTAVRDSAAQLLSAGKITAADAQNVQTQADNARAGIDIARQINATDPAAAQNRITAVITGLNAISAYLTTQGK